MLTCTDNCDIDEHYSDISDYYSSIVTCLCEVTQSVIESPGNSRADKQFTIPGWSDYVADKHDAARSAFLDWVYMGKPRHGPSYEFMYRTRAAFK